MRKLKPDVATVTCSFEVTFPDGNAMKGLYTATMLKTKGTWHVVVGRPMIPFAKPS